MKGIRRKAGLIIVVGAIGFGLSACTDLLVSPESTVTSANVFTDAGAYRSFLAKLYAGFATSGQQGPAGNADIQGIDEGFGQYVRGLWQLQTLPTDEAVIGWGDAGLPEMVTSQWGGSNQFVTAMYYRIFFQVALVNEFLRETSTDALTARGDQGLAEIPQYRAEARFLRALSYWHGLDLFGNIPLVTEDFEAGSPPPDQATRTEIYDFIVSELTDLRTALPAVGAAEYGRADQGAVAMLLAKVYMNAEAYGQGAHYTEARGEVETVIAGPYTLDPVYQNMFLADNHNSPEFIFAIAFDGQSTQTWGGTTFITHASCGGSMSNATSGVDGCWWGLRVTPEWVGLYAGGAGGPDGRSAILYTAGQNLAINSIGDFSAGYAYPKYRNVTSGGAQGSNATHTDNDYPMFRLADAYLMYAEAVLRGGGGDATTALNYVNAIRMRAYGNATGNIAAPALDLAFVLAERGRELAWEGHRRTDLIRYGLFTGGGMLWAWKGNVQGGMATDAHLNLYPIPDTELLSNPNLDQNPGY
jgi:hypothetical protein